LSFNLLGSKKIKMPLPIFEFTIPEPRNVQDRLYDVLMELDYFVDRIGEIKDEITEIWEGIDE
jgi:hypothetical protein